MDIFAEKQRSPAESLGSKFPHILAIRAIKLLLSAEETIFKMGVLPRIEKESMSWVRVNLSIVLQSG